MEFGGHQIVGGTDVFSGFFAAAGEALLILDEAFRVDHANDAALRLLGHVGLHVGCSFADLVDDAARPTVQHLLEMTATGLMSTAESVIDGTSTQRRVPIEITASPFTSGQDRLVGVVVRDRSEAVNASRLLQDRENQYRTVFMRAPLALREEDFSEVGWWLTDLRLRGVMDLDRHLDEHPEELRAAIKSIRTLRVNPACVELMKADHPSQLLAGFRDSELTPEVLHSFREQMLALWRDETSFETELEGRNFKLEPFACRIHWTVRHVGGVPDLSRVVVAILDISTIRAAQQRLETLIEDKDRFIASVTHDLRTPLASVYGLAQELNEHWADFDIEEIRSLIEIIAVQSADLAALVEDLLLVAKLEMDDIVVVPELFDLGALAGRVIDDVQRSDAALPSVGFEARPVFAWADPGRVTQIVRSLLVNASRHGGPDVRVEVNAGTAVVVEVSDDGPGLPPGRVDTVFDAYQQARDDAPLGSLGLGLTIARRLARLMGGDVTYRRDAGRTVFALVLPAEALASIDPAAAATHG